MTGGVHAADGAARALLAGADAVCIASALLARGGVEPVAEILAGLRAWMDAKGFADLAAFRGRLAERDLKDRHGFERAHYVRLLSEQA